MILVIILQISFKHTFYGFEFWIYEKPLKSVLFGILNTKLV